MEKRYLVLQDGRIFEGYAFGAEHDGLGELVFTTGMVGYPETLTDPSYAGQIVIQTFPMIGNYGICEDDFEGEPAVRGYVVREKCDFPSNFRCEYSLDTFLKQRNICGIYGVDTRELTRILREEGVMNAMICREPPADLTALRAYSVQGAVDEVTCRQTTVYPPKGQKKYAVTLIDYGAKRNIIRSLTERGCEVTAVPSFTDAKTILASRPDGIMLSNGPGDPAENKFCIEQLRQLIGQVPIFGICLGHQLTALAMGGRTEKLKYGHRGGNQPVRDRLGSRTYITSQNHGYAVIADSLRGVGREAFVNANDGSCEGMIYPGKRCFTVQFHPEACGGPRDTAFLFDCFIAMMGGQEDA